MIFNSLCTLCKAYGISLLFLSLQLHLKITIQKIKEITDNTLHRNTAILICKYNYFIAMLVVFYM